MELYLIRHAQSMNNARPQSERVHDPSITELGHQQAEYLAATIVGLQLSHLVTSPFLRTLQTTEYLWQSTNLTPEVQVELHERGGCVSGPTPEVMVGQPGMNREEITNRFPTYQIASDIGPHGWWKSRPYESDQLVNERAAALLQRTQQRFGHTSARVAYVMHADFMLVFLRQLGLHPSEVPLNASVTQIRMNSQDLAVEEYNRVAHLPVDARTS